jgi:AraC-like DNA-binding protein
MVPQPGDTALGFTSFIILLGVVQGFILSLAYILRRSRTYVFAGLFLLVATLTILEIFLNRTGYMYYVIRLADFSEPLQFLMMPMLYLCIRSLNPEDKLRNYGWHFLPFVLYFLMFIPFYLAPKDFKLETYYYIHHQVPWHLNHSYPLLRKLGYIRQYQLQICVVQVAIYIVQNFQLLKTYRDRRNIRNHDAIAGELNWWYLVNIMIILLVLMIIAVKITYTRDLGDHIFASFFTLMIYIWMIRDLTKSILSEKKTVSPTATKPEKDLPLDEKKAMILEKIEKKVVSGKLYTDSLISVAKIGKITSEPPYLISQVINEGYKMTFYDWIAFHRIEEAKRLLKDPSLERMTVEEIAERVGYNSKSAFNKSFKKLAGITPSEYRSNTGN